MKIIASFFARLIEAREREARARVAQYRRSGIIAY